MLDLKDVLGAEQESLCENQEANASFCSLKESEMSKEWNRWEEGVGFEK